jgi:hypothetical protein
VTTVNADAIAVLIDSAGQLGTTSSSIRYKENVENISDAELDIVHKLRPVSFNYKTHPHKRSLGLIAEEVEEIDPSLCVYQPKYVEKLVEVSCSSSSSEDDLVELEPEVGSDDQEDAEDAGLDQEPEIDQEPEDLEQDAVELDSDPSSEREEPATPVPSPRRKTKLEMREVKECDELLTVDYIRLNMLVMAEVQRLKKRIDELERVRAPVRSRGK